MKLTDELLTQWREEAEAHPSGQRCNGIHDATTDRRVTVLIDAYRELSDRLAAERRSAYIEALRDVHMAAPGWLDSLAERVDVSTPESTESR